LSTDANIHLIFEHQLVNAHTASVECGVPIPICWQLNLDSLIMVYMLVNSLWDVQCTEITLHYCPLHDMATETY